MKIKKSELRQIINEEISKVHEALRLQPSKAILQIEKEIESKLSPGTIALLKSPKLRLVNLKRFGNSVGRLLRKLKLVKTEGSFKIEYSLLMNGVVVGFIRYEEITSYYARAGRDYEPPQCEAEPFSGKKVYMLTRIARSPQSKGYGIGSLLAFISICQLNKMGHVITSDRNTSQLAGDNLVNKLANTESVVDMSEPFDYIGYFYNKAKIGYEKVGFTAKGQPRRHPKIVRFKDLLDKLEPLTSTEADDCLPSSNIYVGGQTTWEIGEMLKFGSFDAAGKMLKDLDGLNSKKEILNFFNMDKNVQGYSFKLKDWILKAGVQIINAIDESNKFSDDEIKKYIDSGLRMFGDVYDDEVFRPATGLPPREDEQQPAEEEPEPTYSRPTTRRTLRIRRR